MASKDAATASLEKFKDPDLWVVRHGVPVFDVHDDYTPDKLAVIAENCNRRERVTGDPCPITVGHVRDGAEPPVVGFARNFAVGKFGPSQKDGILAEFWYLKDHYETGHKAKDYFRRSVELWPDEQFFDPIALINRTPRRDLGVLLHTRSHKKVLRYAMQDTPGGAEPYPGDIDQQNLGSGMGMSPEEERLYAKFKARLQADGHLDGGLANQQGANLQGGLMPGQRPPTTDTMPTGSGPDIPLAYDKRTDMTATNDTVEKYTKELAESRATVEKMQKDLESHKEAYSKLQVANEQMLKDLADERKARQELEKGLLLKEREADLKELADPLKEGIVFDLKEELELVSSMDAERYTKHKDRMRRLYQKRRPPLGGGFYVSAPAAGSDGTPAAPRVLNADEAKKVRDLALSKGIDYAKARAELFPN